MTRAITSGVLGMPRLQIIDAHEAGEAGGLAPSRW